VYEISLGTPVNILKTNERTFRDVCKALDEANFEPTPANTPPILPPVKKIKQISTWESGAIICNTFP
jgi:hypothetical protein